MSEFISCDQYQQRKLQVIPSAKSIECSPLFFIFTSDTRGRNWDLFRAVICNCPMKLRFELHTLLCREGRHLKLSELEYIKLHI